MRVVDPYVGFQQSFAVQIKNVQCYKKGDSKLTGANPPIRKLF